MIIFIDINIKYMKKARTVTETTKKKIAGSQLWKCLLCSTLLPHTYQVDHIIPFAVGGIDNETNLQALCPNCHSQKSQSEHIRIHKFKKIQSVDKLCWFCLETKVDHVCDKILHDIENVIQNQHETITSFSRFLTKFSYVTPLLSSTLTITLFMNKINVNVYTHHFHNDTESITLSNIQEAIFLSTRSKSQSKLYDKIIVHIIMNNTKYDIEAFKQYLQPIIHTIIPTRILKNTPNITIQSIY